MGYDADTFNIFSALGINKEKKEEYKQARKQYKDKAFMGSLGSTLGSLALMGLTQGMVNPWTIGAATSLGSFVGGKALAATKKLGKGYDWIQDEVDELREEISNNILTQSLSTGLQAGMAQAGKLMYAGKGWGGLTEGWDKTPIGKWQRVRGLAAESGIAPKDINWDIIGGDYSSIEPGNIAATDKLAAERLALAKEFSGETFMEGTGLEGLPAGADYEASKRYYDATHDFPMEFRTASGEVTGSIPAGTDLRVLDDFAKRDIPQPGKLRPWPWEQGPKFKDGQVMPLDSRFKPVRMPGPPDVSNQYTNLPQGGQPVQMPSINQASEANWQWILDNIEAYDNRVMDLIRTENRSLYDYYQEGVSPEEFEQIYEGFDRNLLDIDY